MRIVTGWVTFTDIYFPISMINENECEMMKFLKCMIRCKNSLTLNIYFPSLLWSTHQFLIVSSLRLRKQQRF